MAQNITAVPVPEESIIHDHIAKIDFQDAFQMELTRPEVSIEDVYLRLFSQTPKWVAVLFKLRNRIVKLFGLDTGNGAKEFRKEDIAVGKKIGLFTVYAIEKEELIAGQDDKHLNFRVSLLKKDKLVTVSTLVEYNNLFGRIYMTIVMPFHKLVVKAMMRRVVKSGEL